MIKSNGVAIITGASSGIGAIYADRLAKRGHDLVLVARRRERLEEHAEILRDKYGCKVDVMVADLSTENGIALIENLIQSTENFRVLANVAGLGALGYAAKVDAKLVDDMLKVNVLALTRLSLAAARRLVEVKSGTIINISSIMTVMPVSGAGAYSGSKAYVLNFSRSLQSELAESGVTVQVVLPSMVRSEFFGDKPAPFPEHLFMEAETLVDTAFTALDQGETITFPTLENTETWDQFEETRKSLVKQLTQTGQSSSRYSNLNK